MSSASLCLSSFSHLPYVFHHPSLVCVSPMCLSSRSSSVVCVSLFWRNSFFSSRPPYFSNIMQPLVCFGFSCFYNCRRPFSCLSLSSWSSHRVLFLFSRCSSFVMPRSSSPDPHPSFFCFCLVLTPHPPLSLLPSPFLLPPPSIHLHACFCYNWYA